MFKTHPLKMPCGGIAYYNSDSEFDYKCASCFAVIRSIGMPKLCKDEMDKWTMWETVAGKGWDYIYGRPETSFDEKTPES